MEFSVELVFGRKSINSNDEFFKQGANFFRIEQNAHPGSRCLREYGKHAAGILASSNLVSEVVIAGRNLEATQKCARDLGEKARGVSIDIFDEDRLVALARDCDLVVNTAGPEYELVLKILRAVIRAGTNYCDISADGPTMEKALELDSAAKEKNVTALLGIGLFPGLSNFLMMHAIRQLDIAEEVHFGFFLGASALGDTKERLRSYRDTGRISVAWQMIMKWATPPFRVFRGGKLTAVESKTDEVRIRMPRDGEISAVLGGSTETITIPRAHRGIRDAQAFLVWYPFQLNDRYRELGQRVNEGGWIFRRLP